MAALSDLDLLLGDLEKTCQQQGEQVSNSQAAEGSRGEEEGDEEVVTTGPGQRAAVAATGGGDDDDAGFTNGSRNELDEMLNELTAARSEIGQGVMY